VTSIDEAGIIARCDDLLEAADPASTHPRNFFGEQFDRGLAWVHFPEGHGGLSASPSFQRIINERLAEAGAPLPEETLLIGHGMGAPTVVTHGSEQQKRRYLRPLFTGEEIWCQLFSEPGAGSDVAGLSTRAARDGDEWVVDGQKVWTTFAHIARFGMLVARSNPDVPKHRGLTYFVLDMHAPGVHVRPLYQMTGDAEFNEVFLDGVRIPDSERLGEEGEGWRVVLTTLMNERVAIGGSTPPRGSGFIGELLEIWNRVGGGGPATKDRLVGLWIDAEALRLTNIRAAQARSGGSPGAEGSLGKIMSAMLNQKITSLAVELLGAGGMLKPRGYPMERVNVGDTWPDPVGAFLRSPANSIEGGTTEIARNIVAERVLGLPSDVRFDRDVPWTAVARG
jgi:alkylation response protein AidB-like acyl-CoA dehydrogenase